MLCVKYMFGFLLNLHEYNLKNEKKKKLNVLWLQWTTVATLMIKNI